MWATNLNDCNDPSDYAYCTCAVYSCGYSQPNRKYISVDLLELGCAECDCSSGVSWWLYKGGFINQNPWFHTKNEIEILLNQGFKILPFDAGSLKRNDVLWKYGHTGLYIGNGLQAEALRDENHQAGYEGTEGGDQDGGETVVREVTHNWEFILRKDNLEKGDDMTFLFTCDGKYSGNVWFYDGGVVYKVQTKEQQEALKYCHVKATSKELPFFHVPNGGVIIDMCTLK